MSGVRSTGRLLPGIAFLLGVVLGGLPAAGAGEDSGNPHASLGCAECHRSVPEPGKTPPAKVLEGLAADPVPLCRNCHSVEETSHHPVVRRTERAMPEGLPLSLDGFVICSTCHDVHLKRGGNRLLRGYDTGRYSVRMDMCLDCHGKEFGAINPHMMGARSEKCYTCHSRAPGSGSAPSSAAFRGRLEEICDFCHNVSRKEHPSNVDPLRKLPDALPRGAGGAVHCGTCHDPHGTGDTLHFLRAGYVGFLEKGRHRNPHGVQDYDGCLGCHSDVSTEREKMRANLRYGGDRLQICLSCHGAMDACHPILIRPPEGKNRGEEALPLSEDGKLTCLTCHDPMPRAGSGVAIRGRKPGERANAICFRCHEPSDLVGRNPHSTMDDRTSCRFCHDTMTDPTNEEAAKVSFISNTRLICMRCHPQENHPMGVDHMVVPKTELPAVFRPDGLGRLTCTSCHNPHIDAAQKSRGRRFVVEGQASTLCSICHKR